MSHRKAIAISVAIVTCSFALIMAMFAFPKFGLGTIAFLIALFFGVGAYTSLTEKPRGRNRRSL